MSDAVGYGVVATRDIPKGTILWALDPLDRVFGAADLIHLDRRVWAALEVYSYVNGRGQRVLCWDHGRFMNHSCEPVSLSPGVDFELAVRDIEEGEEITCDYASLNLESDLACLCMTPSCRGVVSSSQFVTLAARWDVQLREAVAAADTVPQPLATWVDRDQLGHWARQPDTLPSAMAHHYPQGDSISDAGRVH